MHLRQIPFESQVNVDLEYKGIIIKGQRIDLVVFETVIVEIKAVTNLPSVCMAQLLSYLRATNLKRGLILNFGEELLKDGIKRITV